MLRNSITITQFIANVRVTADEYSGTFLHRQPLSSTLSHSCDVRLHQTVFFIRTTNFASSLTQQHCLQPQCYCCWWNWQNRTKCTVQQPFTLPTDSVQWKVCGVGATDWMVAVHNTVIHLVVCVWTACCCSK